MDMVTTLAASVLCAGIHGASAGPGSARVAEQIIFIDASGSLEAQATAQNSTDDQQLDFWTIGRWQHFIAEASRRFGIPEIWIRAVIEAESAGETTRDGRPITSRTGAMGIMQVMPDTYAEMGARNALGPDPYDPRDSILAGTAYLRAMYDRYGYPGFFAAYNAGPTRFDAYLLRGVPLPEETQQYLLSIGPDIREAVIAQRPDAVVQS